MLHPDWETRASLSVIAVRDVNKLFPVRESKQPPDECCTDDKKGHVLFRTLRQKAIAKVNTVTFSGVTGLL